MSIFEPTHTASWKLGKKGNDGRGRFNKRALIICFSTMKSRKEFLKKSSTLKETRIFSSNDPTLAHIAHARDDA